MTHTNNAYDHRNERELKRKKEEDEKKVKGRFFLFETRLVYFCLLFFFLSRDAINGWCDVEGALFVCALSCAGKGVVSAEG